MWKEAGTAQFKVLSWHVPVGTRENHENPQADKRIFGPSFEPRISWIRIRSANNSAATFGLEGGYRK
jgi:hypothetical protein